MSENILQYNLSLGLQSAIHIVKKKYIYIYIRK